MTSKQKEVEKEEEGTGLSCGVREPKIRELSTFEGDREDLRDRAAGRRKSDARQECRRGSGTGGRNPEEYGSVTT